MNSNYSKITGLTIVMFLLVFPAADSCKRQGGTEGLKEQNTAGSTKKYICSMHPQVLSDIPGNCPICGMFLIEKIEQDMNSFDSSLTEIVRPVNEYIFGSAFTVKPEKRVLPLTIEASGIINYDPRKIITISARFGGLIERSYVKYQFQYINQGQKIYEIYSPDIYTKQWDYVKLIQAYPDKDELTVEAREWLSLLGLSKGQVDSLKRSVQPDYHLPVYSYAEGYAVGRDFNPESFFSSDIKEETKKETFLAGTGSIGLNDGDVVETGTPLFKLIDIRALRVDLKVKTEDGSLLKKGQKVIITDAANPGRQFNASTSQIDPLNGGLFQSVQVYIIDNERLLLPGRQIKGMIIVGTRDCLWVPLTAVVNRGQHCSVFEMRDNKFVATEVITGARSNDKIEILSGIDLNSMIAEKALLLTDSDGFINTNLK